MIPAAAVEAAAKGIFDVRDDPYDLDEWGDLDATAREPYVCHARAALEAAAPHIREDKRGDGDYRPGWDDRKTLSSLWQEHAPLPDEGLSERVYEALIAVATWGYQQRKDEEL